jgi:SH3-like domain-containing protein
MMKLIIPNHDLLCRTFMCQAHDHRQGPNVKMMRAILLTLLSFCLVMTYGFATPVKASDEISYDTPTNLPVPRWASLGKKKVYARSGPTKENKIIWTYLKKDLPIQIISETKEWRLICDPDGGRAWVHKSMIRSQRFVIATGTQGIDIQTGPKPDAKIKARLRPRALASLDRCQKGYCKIKVGRETGWALQKNLWGSQEGAVCKRPEAMIKLS